MSLLNFVLFSAAPSRSKVTESVKVTHGTVRDFHGLDYGFHGLDYGEQALKLSKQPKSSWCGVFFPRFLSPSHRHVQVPNKEIRSTTLRTQCPHPSSSRKDRSFNGLAFTPVGHFHASSLRPCIIFSTILVQSKVA